MKENELLKLIEKELKSKKGENVDIVDVKEKTPFVDYYILVTAMNIRHIDALKKYVEDFLEENKINVKHSEGKPESGWILIDAGNIVINIFSKQERERINLEELIGTSIKVNATKKVSIKKTNKKVTSKKKTTRKQN